MFTRLINSPTFQSIMAALGRGVVMAALAYFGMLVKHVTDYDTIIGTVGIVFLIPLAGLLHLVVPTVPGMVTMAQRWPRVGGTPPDEPRGFSVPTVTITGGGSGATTITVPPDLPRPEQSSDHVAAAVQQRTPTGRFAPRVIPPVPPTP